MQWFTILLNKLSLLTAGKKIPSGIPLFAYHRFHLRKFAWWQICLACYLLGFLPRTTANAILPNFNMREQLRDKTSRLHLKGGRDYTELDFLHIFIAEGKPRNPGMFYCLISFLFLTTEWSNLCITTIRPLDNVNQHNSREVS